MRRARRVPGLAALLLLPVAGVLALMVVVPLIVLVWFSLAPDGAAAPLSLDSYARLVGTGLYLRLAGKTLLTAGAASLLTAALGWYPAWALSRLPARLRNLVLLAVIVPYLTSTLLLIYSVFVILGPGSPLMVALRLVGLARPGASILYSPAATLVMLVYENLPLMVFVLFTGMQQVDASLLAAAGSLGATRWQRMAGIVVPLAAPSLVTAVIVVFVPMGGAFVEPAILGGAERAAARQRHRRPDDARGRPLVRRRPVAPAAARHPGRGRRAGRAAAGAGLAAGGKAAAA